MKRKESFGLQLLVFCAVTAWWYGWAVLNRFVPDNLAITVMSACGQLWFFAAASRAARADLTCNWKWYAITFVFFMTPLVIFGVFVEVMILLNWAGNTVIRAITRGGKS